MKLRFILSNPGMTQSLGRCLAHVLGPNDVILMSGDLGAGKTTLTKNIVKWLGVEEKEVTSPSFSLIHEYKGDNLTIIHADMYRLGPFADIEETGLEDYIERDNLVIIEWSEFLDPALFSRPLLITLAWLDEEAREIEITGTTDYWESRLGKVADCMKSLTEGTGG